MDNVEKSAVTVACDAAPGAASYTAAAVHEVAQRAAVASRTLRVTSEKTLNKALDAIASGLETAAPQIIAANQLDMERAARQGMSGGLQDRLRLGSSRVTQLATAVREIRALRSPVGEVLWGRRLENGLEISQQRVPLGVVAMIYEARPGVTVDAAALCLKTGNTVILRGGSAARETNRELVAVMRVALAAVGLPEDCVQTLDDMGREAVREVLRERELVDLAIPRGGTRLIQLVVETATVPVIETGVGNCHIYVDASADLTAAQAIVLNAKTQRVGVCNAVETLLVDRGIFVQFLRELLPALHEVPVRIHADEDTAAVAAQVGVPTHPATEIDWATEYLDYDLAVRVVNGVEAAIAHIEQYSSGHTEAVLAEETRVIERFVSAVDTAVVNVNASTRFTDGGQFGFGAEIGISTQKLHARGPMGMEALTTVKSLVRGQGQVRNE